MIWFAAGGPEIQDGRHGHFRGRTSSCAGAICLVPGAGALLADQGAEVIKIETPGTSDPYRTLAVGDGHEVGSTNLAMEQKKRGKKIIGLDLFAEMSPMGGVAPAARQGPSLFRP